MVEGRSARSRPLGGQRGRPAAGDRKGASRTFRYFLSGGIKLHVNETELLAHDPLFVMEDTWANRELAKDAKRRAQEEAKKQGKARAGAVASHFPARVLCDEPLRIGGGEARLIVTLYPEEVTRRRQQGGDPFVKRLRVPDNQGQISFVRLNGEINYALVPRVFNTAVEDVDRFIGVEVRFNPDLDEYFGVRNVERGVEPHGDLRTHMRKLLGRYVKEARAIIRERWDESDSEQPRRAGARR